MIYKESKNLPLDPVTLSSNEAIVCSPHGFNAKC